MRCSKWVRHQDLAMSLARLAPQSRLQTRRHHLEVFRLLSTEQGSRRSQPSRRPLRRSRRTFQLTSLSTARLRGVHRHSTRRQGVGQARPVQVAHATIRTCLSCRGFEESQMRLSHNARALTPMLRLWNGCGRTQTHRLIIACVANPTRPLQSELERALTHLLWSRRVSLSIIITSARLPDNTALGRDKMGMRDLEQCQLGIDPWPSMREVQQEICLMIGLGFPHARSCRCAAGK